MLNEREQQIEQFLNGSAEIQLGNEVGLHLIETIKQLRKELHDLTGNQAELVNLVEEIASTIQTADARGVIKRF